MPARTVTIDFVAVPGVAEKLERMTKPYREKVARTIAGNIAGNVPRRRGVVAGTYRPDVDISGDRVRVLPGSPFWAIIEYGTATSPPYAPIRSAVSASGARFTDGR